MTLMTYICFRSRKHALRGTHDWLRLAPITRNLRLFRQTKAPLPEADEPAYYSSQVDCPGKVLTVDEAARQLRISRWSLYRLIQQRQIKTIKIGRRRLIAVSAVDDLIKQLQEEAD